MGKRIAQILADQEVHSHLEVQGWLRTKRVSKNCAFLSVNDGSCHSSLQLVVDASNIQAFEKVAQLTTGSSLRARGALKSSPAKGQSVELGVEDLTIIGRAEEDYPLQKKGHSLEFLREIGHLRGRTNTFGSVFRVRNALAQATHDFFRRRGFCWVHTPIITSSDAEGAGELFKVVGTGDHASGEFFGREAYLTVSGQLEAEFLALSLGNVYTFGPTFRAENSNTSRHLSEFWMIEPEMAFTDLEGDMSLAEDFLRFILRQTLEQCLEDLEFLSKFYPAADHKALSSLVESPFERISYTDAIKILTDSGRDFEYPVNWGVDLQTEHERFLVEQVFKCPVIVKNYPKEIKAFYMRLNDDQKTVAAMDMLIPGVGELIGGSQREERLPILEHRMTELGVDAEHLRWYTDLRRYGSVPHAGFGLGFERLVMYVTGMANIRDVIPCPRAPGLISF